eukprot:13785770-Alexandrium_andersonii.AAC.1
MPRARQQVGGGLERAKSLQAFEPGTARAQERPQNWSPQLPRGGFCAIFAQMTNLPMKQAGGRARGASWG